MTKPHDGTPTPTRSGPKDECDIEFATTLGNPDPTLVSQLAKYETLPVALMSEIRRGQQVELLAATKGGKRVGTIDDVRGDPIVACIRKGRRFQAVVVDLKNGQVRVDVKPA
jgi:hypothetical protein